MTFPMGGARLTSCILHRLERIGIFIYGSGAVLYTELTHQSQGIDLYDVVSKKWSIPIHVQTLIHGGKRVNAVDSIVHQGIVHGSNVFLVTRAKGVTAISVMANMIMIIIISCIFDLTFVTYFDISIPLFLK